jgi:hypothetical protein
VTINSKWGYPAEKFSAARRMLLLPHPSGEAQSLASAFHECLRGLDRIPRDDLDANARAWVGTVERTMDDTGIEDPDGERGTWFVKAQGLTDQEKQQFSDAVDHLASWFDHHFYGLE